MKFKIDKRFAKIGKKYIEIEVDDEWSDNGNVTYYKNGEPVIEVELEDAE